LKMADFPDDTLVRYVLGDLPPEQAEPLDQRSIVDGPFAERLRSIEHDLADAYVRGELSPDERLRWERTSGASKAGREQVRLAEALASAERRRASAARFSMTSRSSRTSRWNLGLAAAAALALTLTGAYILRGHPAPPALATMAPGGQLSEPSFVALTLPQPSRGVTEPPVLLIPAGMSEARLTLRLEPSALSQYALSLRDLASGRVVWQASDLTAAEGAEGRVLAVTVPANVFHPGRFAFEAAGVDSGRSLLVATYPLTVN
jgi:hypothetical protein